jgi:hypothetical protein
MLKCTININAITEEEIIYTLEEVMRKLRENNLTGYDQRENEIDCYDFDISGEESEYIECKECFSNNYYEDNEPENCQNCGADLTEQ